MGLTINRRQFVVALGVVIRGPSAHAQTSEKRARIGYLLLQPIEAGRPYVKVFEERLRQLGLGVTPSDVVFETCSAEGRVERLDDCSTELINRKVDIIVAVNHAAVAAARRRAFRSSWCRAAVVWWPGAPEPVSLWSALQDPARKLGLTLSSHPFSDAKDLEQSFQSLKRERVDGVLVSGDTVAYRHRRHILDLMTALRRPAMYSWSEFVDDGGLISYGLDVFEFFRSAADYAARRLD